MKQYNRVLTIAGSDSGGGAGIQADLKTISALGCYGMSVITALTAQNTVAVTGIYPVDADFVGKQIDAVICDIGVDAVKIGMLLSAEVIKVIARKLQEYKIKKIVLDPVMVAKSGDKLLQDDAINALKEKLIPLATIITPNLPEAEVLIDHKLNDKEDVELAAKKLLDCNNQAILIKGGHFVGDESSDCLILKEKDQIEIHWLKAQRIYSANTHGTGCTLSSAIASFMARDYSIFEAVRAAKDYITNAIIKGAEYKIGEGHGPVHHFYALWEEKE
ncbi:MAG: bifunctional hydroxymethylpyrimidine kinase/phosphomethylpyrimidine kinase [Candidatus Cloacimonetes bacterium]|nr:bifunctional hydroxymethylpyrimidine kinase/phosphomethylpyrimidine kinase [Candidatus Cloacimonadota bacterium]